MNKVKITLAVLLLPLCGFFSYGQTFHLFSAETKKEYPSVVYDFLERYLYVIDSMEVRGDYVGQKLHDDKVVFTVGSAYDARRVTHHSTYSITAVNDLYYEVEWSDSLGTKLLGLAFPMQYELLLGKPKAEIEKDFRIELSKERDYVPKSFSAEELRLSSDGYLVNKPTSHYYVEDLNTAMYFYKEDYAPVFDSASICQSAANLFQGCIEHINGYTLSVEQQLYGYRSDRFDVPLEQWLSYCQAMKLITYFAVEEDFKDCLKALLIVQSKELGFNHMMSLVIPKSIVSERNSVIKGKLNAYIPIHNVKDLYQQYVEKKKKKIW